MSIAFARWRAQRAAGSATLPTLAVAFLRVGPPPVCRLGFARAIPAQNPYRPSVS